MTLRKCVLFMLHVGYIDKENKQCSDILLMQFTLLYIVNKIIINLSFIKIIKNKYI